MIPYLRTPDNRFKRLSHYPFAPHYVELNSESLRADGIEGLRMHYVDEGSPDADPVLMLHGEPSWSYLYRYMIPVCAAAGHRVIAPDLIGFGKSDKPVNTKDYSYLRHMKWLQAFIDQLDLKNITLVCQDWGSLLGLRLAAENDSRFKAIVVGNGMLPTGEQNLPAAFKLWRAFALHSPWFPISRIVEFGSFKRFSKDERQAYDAPFPSAKYKAGARAFPALVPSSTDDPASAANIAAWEVLKNWQKPFLTLFSNGDPITRGGDKYMQQRIPGANKQAHSTLKGGHFLQEDAGFEFAQAINRLLAQQSLAN